jgi:hypothetical protein
VRDIVKIYCNSCKGETNHDINSSHDQSYHEEYEDHGQRFSGYYEETEFLFLTCRGCDSETVQEKWTCAGMYDHNGDEIYSYDYHLKRKNLGEREAKNFLKIK